MQYRIEEDNLRVLRNNKDPYVSFPVLGNKRFWLREIQEGDINDLLKVYSDKEAVKYFNSDNCDGDDFYYTTIERMKRAIEVLG